MRVLGFKTSLLHVHVFFISFFLSNELSSEQNNMYILANSLKSLLAKGIGSDFTGNNATAFLLGLKEDSNKKSHVNEVISDF